MKALKWPQVHAWRLSQHGLSPRLSSGEVVEAVRRTAGIQAQVMSAAELALCTRVEGLSVQEIRSALWPDRTLVKTWALRATLHILATDDLPLYVAALSLREFRNWSAHFAYYGLSPAQHETFLAAGPSAVTSVSGQTRGRPSRLSIPERGVVHGHRSSQSRHCRNSSAAICGRTARRPQQILLAGAGMGEE